MATNWRRKTYYRTRVLLDTQHILAPTFSDCVVCLTGPQLEMMRNLTQYLHRRSTFADGYETDYYLAPTEAEWDDIQAIVADLENTLMNCDEFTAKLESILDAALCACAGTDGGYTSPVTGPIYDNYEDDGLIKWESPDPTPTPAEAKMCDLAQLVYAWNYEVLTEILQPTQEAGHEVLLFLIFEKLALIIGGPPALLPGAAVYYVVQALLDAWVEGSLANVVNALVANKNELICAMYLEFVASGDYGDAADAAHTIIDGVGAWSAIDKALFKLTFSPLVMFICNLALVAESDWATSTPAAAYCVDCEDIIEGDGWWAQPIVGEYGEIELHNTESGWESDTFVVDIPDALLVGIIYEVGVKDAQSGLIPDGDVGRCPIDGRHQLVIAGYFLAEETTYFHTVGDDIYDWEDAQSVLAAGCELIPLDPDTDLHFAKKQGPATVQYCWSLGTVDPPYLGDAYVTVTYLVYKEDV